MSGQVGNNILRTSGVVAATAAGLNWVSTVVTASTLTAEAGNGYFINTTSNTCTITLPSSAEAGDQIVFMDYVRTWGTNKIIIDSNGLNYQGEDDTYTVEYDTNGETVNIVYADATQGWIPLDDDVVTDAPTPPPTQKAIFGMGYIGAATAITNLVNSSGVVATDTAAAAGVTARDNAPGGAGYGGDKAIFAFGGYPNSNLSNLISNSGVVASDTAGVGTARRELTATEYGVGLAIFGFGYVSGAVSMTNLVSYSGVVASDVTGVGTAGYGIAAARYGGDKALFGYRGYPYKSMTNLVSNVGVVATDTAGVGTARQRLSAAAYGGDKAIFGFGEAPSMAITNLVSNTGVVATDTAGVGTGRSSLAAADYGGDKAIFGFGYTGSNTGVTNLVSNSGVVASDTAAVGTARYALTAAGYSTSA